VDPVFARQEFFHEGELSTPWSRCAALPTGRIAEPAGERRRRSW
jgi:hypothetical protein